MAFNETAVREEMIERQIEARGIVEPSLLRAMRRIPRSLFVHENLRPSAYQDEPYPIGCRQTITPPFIVAYMIEALALKATDRVLEIGTGTGYQTTVLAEMVSEVLTVEIHLELAAAARKTIAGLGYTNVKFKTGDGAEGWAEGAPFDAIVVTAATAGVPAALSAQLGEGGRLIVPLGLDQQTLKLFRKKDGLLAETPLLCVKFGPLLEAAPKEAP